MKKEKTTIGRKIAQLRKAQGLNQTEFAKILGLTRRAIEYYENEANSLTIDTLTKFAEALRTDPKELLGENENNISQTTPAPIKVPRALKKFETLNKTNQKAVIKFINALARD